VNRWILIATSLLLTLTNCAPSASHAGTGPDEHASYTGIGLVGGAIHGDNRAVDGRSGAGIHISFGRRIHGRWFVDSYLGGYTIDTRETPDIYYPADGADVFQIDVVLLYYILDEQRKWRPWAVAGPSYHYLGWESFAYSLSGLGLGLGGGCDIALFERVSLRIGLRINRFTAETDIHEASSGTGHRQVQLHAGGIVLLR
jgi:hypothetical protein